LSFIEEIKMKNKRIFRYPTFFFLIIILAVGCVQMPTEKQSIPDLRPSISFRTESQALYNARVFVDGQDMGRIGDFVEGVSALRILPGSHNLRILSGQSVLMDERIYLADGVHRSFYISGIKK